MLVINEVKTPVGAGKKEILEALQKKLKTGRIKDFRILKKSLDARKEVKEVYTLLIETDREKDLLRFPFVKVYIEKDLKAPHLNTDKTAVIIGYGPSGIFSALRLNEAGIRVKVFERGKRISEREKDVERFFREGILNEDSNIQFGEGGAGTFSDAKLTTRIKDKYVRYILDTFIRHGAKEEISYVNHAHVGTDEIRKVISNITDSLIKKGVEFHFEEEVKDFVIEEDTFKAVVTDKGRYEADYCLLGCGHSAYSTVQVLKNRNIYMEKKDFAVGFRVEHPQYFIDERQTGHQTKEANEYFLTHKDLRGVYSFCMCPGGLVIPAMSEEETVVTNGMSYAARDSGYANSAILIQVDKEECEDGYEYLQDIERRAYVFSSSFKALSQNIRDFMNDELHPLIFRSSYPLGTVLYNFNDLFTPFQNKILKEAFEDFDRKIPGFIERGIMIGPETRSSSPVRIRRNEKGESISTKNFYPMGEGSGYGGGIMSCALDGIRIANFIIDRLK